MHSPLQTHNQFCLLANNPDAHAGPVNGIPGGFSGLDGVEGRGVGLGLSDPGLCVRYSTRDLMRLDLLCIALLFVRVASLCLHSSQSQQRCTCVWPAHRNMHMPPQWSVDTPTATHYTRSRTLTPQTLQSTFVLTRVDAFTRMHTWSLVRVLVLLISYLVEGGGAWDCKEFFKLGAQIQS